MSGRGGRGDLATLVTGHGLFSWFFAKMVPSRPLIVILTTMAIARAASAFLTPPRTKADCHSAGIQVSSNHGCRERQSSSWIEGRPHSFTDYTAFLYCYHQQTTTHPSTAAWPHSPSSILCYSGYRAGKWVQDAEEQDLSGDGGVTKRVIRPGWGYKVRQSIILIPYLCHIIVITALMIGKQRHTKRCCWSVFRWMSSCCFLLNPLSYVVTATVA